MGNKWSTIRPTLPQSVVIIDQGEFEAMKTNQYYKLREDPYRVLQVTCVLLNVQ